MLRRLLRCICTSLLAVIVVMPAIPCSASTPPETLMLAIKGEPEEGYDPILGWGMYGNPLFQSTLLRRDEELRIVPALATQYSQSEDRVQWRVTIRSDAVFSGRAMFCGESWGNR